MYRFVTVLAVVVSLLGSARLAAQDAPAQEETAVESAAVSSPGGESIEGPGDEANTVREATAHVEVDHADLEGGANGHGDPSASEHDSGHGSHHDPYDLSHMNAGPKLNQPDEFRSDLAIWTFVVFICLLLILGKFAWGPVTAGLDQREHAIAAMIEEAKQGQQQAAEQVKQYEAKLAAASEEARELVAQARKDAESAKDRILAEAQVAADRQRQRAIEDIQVAKNVALQEISEKSVDLAVNLAGRIVRQQLNAADHSQLIREAMDQLPSRN